MADYKLYFLDGQGRIRRAIDLSCEDDEHAIRTVNEQARGLPMQLWEGDRLVKEFLSDETA